MEWSDFLDFFEFRVTDGADVDGTDARILGELHVGKRISDHNGVGKINIRKVPLRLESHAWLGFAAVAASGREVGTAVDAVEGDVASSKLLLHPFVHAVNLVH